MKVLLFKEQAVCVGHIADMTIKRNNFCNFVDMLTRSNFLTYEQNKEIKDSMRMEEIKWPVNKI